MAKMTPERYIEFQNTLFEEMKTLTKAKNQDYTAGSGDPFANFREAEGFGVDTLRGLCIRMGDKFQRIKAYMVNGELAVANEGLEDAFKDLIGYSCLALGLIEEDKREEGDRTTPKWEEAPDWANWVAQDEDGEWFWFEVKPKLASDNLWETFHRTLEAGFGRPPKAPLTTLQERPQ